MSRPVFEQDFRRWMQDMEDRIARLEKPLPLAGIGRWIPTNHAAAAGSYYAWTPHTAASVDGNFYALDTAAGKAANTMVRILVPGWYHVYASVLQEASPATDGRYDVYLGHMDANKNLASYIDMHLVRLAGAHTKATVGGTWQFGVNEGVSVINVTATVYGPTMWSKLEMRYLGPASN